MISHTTKKFRKMLLNLPENVRQQANEAFDQFQQDPFHPGLNFKRVHSSRPIYAARITKDYRAVGIQKNGLMIWFWIGSHSDYDLLLKQL